MSYSLGFWVKMLLILCRLRWHYNLKFTTCRHQPHLLALGHICRLANIALKEYNSSLTLAFFLATDLLLAGWERFSCPHCCLWHIPCRSCWAAANPQSSPERPPSPGETRRAYPSAIIWEGLWQGCRRDCYGSHQIWWDPFSYCHKSLTLAMIFLWHLWLDM